MEEDKAIDKKLILIGGSAGSLSVLLYLFPALKPLVNTSIVIVLHRALDNSDVLSYILSEKSTMIIKEAEEKEPIKEGMTYIAPSDYHLLFEKDHTFSLDLSEKVNYSRPSIDVVMQSAADVYKSNLVAVLLSGANADGAEGLKYVQEQGGITIVQHPATAEVAYMPEQAISTHTPNHILTPSQLLTFLNSLF